MFVGYLPKERIEITSIMQNTFRPTIAQPRSISEVTHKINELPLGDWRVTLCYNEDRTYSDYCGLSMQNKAVTNFEVKFIGNQMRLLWYGNTLNSNYRNVETFNFFGRDRKGNRFFRCSLRDRVIAAIGYQEYRCWYGNRPLDSNFIIIGSSSYAVQFGQQMERLWLSPVDVIGMEVTQGIQNWMNEIQLIRGKETVVRAFIQSSNSMDRLVSGNLLLKKQKRAQNGGYRTVSTKEIYPLNPGMVVNASSNATSNRDDITSSLNFALPNNLTALNDDERLNIRLEFNTSENANCSQTIENRRQNVCVLNTTFTKLDEPEIRLVSFVVNSEDGELSMSLSGINQQVDYMRSLLPFNFDNRIIYHYLLGPIDSNTNLDDVNQILRNQKRELFPESSSGNGNEPLFLGILPGESRGENVGLAINSNAGVASWFIQGVTENGDSSTFFADSRNVGSHEVSHLLGVPHTLRDHDEDPETDLEGTCGEDPGRYITKSEDRTYDNEYPYFHAIENIDTERPLLGELTNDNNQIWGTDTRSFQLYYDSIASGNLARSQNYRDLAIIDPLEVFSYMSYCPPVEERSQGKWLDRYNFMFFLQEFQANEESSSQALSIETTNVKTNSDMFSGSILLSSEGIPTDAELNHVYSRPRKTHSVRPGNYSLVLKDEFGVALKEVSFAASESIGTPNPNYNNESNNQKKLNFSFVVSEPPNYSKVTIMHNSQEVKSFDLSDHSPVVSIVKPRASSAFNNEDSISASWVGSDTDDEKLRYRLYYSTDAGQTYSIVALGIENSSINISTSRLPASSQARIGISVSDGLRSSFAESSLFSVSEHPPEVEIISPLSGAVLTERQSFVLKAQSYDLEDGVLPASSLSWSSSIDGLIGIGKEIVLSATDLRVGMHTITVTASDSSDMSSTATTKITISSYNSAPVAIVDSASVLYGSSVTIDATSNDIDLENDIDHSSFEIIEYPEKGEIEIITDPLNRNIIKFTGNQIGLDSLTYRICDSLNRCSKAYVFIDICTHLGTEGNDSIVGSSGDDFICGLGGNDTIDGRGGNDIVFAGDGNDTIYGRTGNDEIYGESDDDTILGHRGEDRIHGGPGSDELYGGGGNDTIYGNKGNDQIYGESDNDVLEGNHGNDKIHGGRGNDVIYGGAGDDTIRGNQGADRIVQGKGIDTILGASAEDIIE